MAVVFPQLPFLRIFKHSVNQHYVDSHWAIIISRQLTQRKKHPVSRPHKPHR